ncbi:MAG: hypothetical protein GC154_12280 [bacterium]|nr:hypothetical protein [bacterium]
MKRNDWLAVLGVMLFAGLALGFRYQTIDHATTAEWGYVNAGAVNPYYGVPRPYGYRVLMAVLLNLAGVIPKPGEPLVPLTAAVLLIGVFYGFLRALRFPIQLAALGAILLTGCNGMLDLLKDFAINNTDTSSHILVLASLWAMAARNDALVSAMTLLGVFNREWALVLLPVWYLHRVGFKLNSAFAFRFARVSIPSILVYLMVRYIYFPNTALGVMSAELHSMLPPDESVTLAYYWFELGRASWSVFFHRVASMRFYEFSTMGLVPFALAGWRYAPYEWRRVFAFYAFLCVAQLYITTDVWRLAFYLFPVTIALLIYWLQSIEQRAGLRMAIIVGVISIVLFLPLQQSYLSLFVGVLVVSGVEMKIKIHHTRLNSN